MKDNIKRKKKEKEEEKFVNQYSKNIKSLRHSLLN